MKTPSTALFELIKSLSKSEKRYFNRMANLNSEGTVKNYIRLFDYIDGQQIYDEAAVKQHFIGETFLKQLTSTKNYLYNLILKSLEHFYASSIELPYSLLSQVSILYRKGLYELGEKLLIKLKKIALDEDLKRLMPEILMWEYKFLGIKGFGKQEIFKEIFEQLKRIKNLFEYIQIYYETKSFHQNTGGATTKRELKHLDQIIDYPIMANVNKALSSEAKKFYFSIYGLFYSMKSDHVSAHSASKGNLRISESEIWQIKKNPGGYTGSLINMAGSALAIGKFNEVLEYINKIRSFAEKNTFKKTAHVDLYVFLSYAFELKLYLLQGDFRKGARLMNRVQIKFEYFANKLERDWLAFFRYLFASTKFLSKDYNGTTRWINEILNDTALTSTRQDLLAFTRILNLILHYEMRDYNYINYLVVSTYRFLSKKEHIFKFERAILTFIKDRNHELNEAALNNEFEKLYSSFKKLLKDPLEMEAINGVIFLMPWLESKIGKQSVKSGKGTVPIAN